MTSSAPRGRLALLLALWVVSICVVTPVVVHLVEPRVGGWDETVGYIAGMIVACIGIGGILRLTR